ncbi:MAG: hypothetical protein S4CHLAM102_02830 [Chlamydiia bacterium]|nr:hypothetical protein [Chlamydiia bacterium]
MALYSLCKTTFDAASWMTSAAGTLVWPKPDAKAKQLVSEIIQGVAAAHISRVSDAQKCVETIVQAHFPKASPHFYARIKQVAIREIERGDEQTQVAGQLTLSALMILAGEADEEETAELTLHTVDWDPTFENLQEIVEATCVSEAYNAASSLARRAEPWDIPEVFIPGPSMQEDDSDRLDKASVFHQVRVDLERLAPAHLHLGEEEIVFDEREGFTVEALYTRLLEHPLLGGDEQKVLGLLTMIHQGVFAPSAEKLLIEFGMTTQGLLVDDNLPDGELIYQHHIHIHEDHIEIVNQRNFVLLQIARLPSTPIANLFVEQTIRYYPGEPEKNQAQSSWSVEKRATHLRDA